MKNKIIENHICHSASYRKTDQDAHHCTREGNNQNHLKIMPSYGNVAVSERFENSNLFPLQADQPADYNIEQKSRNGEKNQRQQDSHRLELLNFLRNQVMRELIILGIRTLVSVNL